jgi:hypothetical protein
MRKEEAVQPPMLAERVRPSPCGVSMGRNRLAAENERANEPSEGQAFYLSYICGPELWAERDRESAVYRVGAKHREPPTNVGDLEPR